MRIAIVGFLLLAQACVPAQRTQMDTSPAVPLPSVQSESEERRISYEDLLRLRDIGAMYQEDGLAMSPDGTSVAFQIRRAYVTSNSYGLSWYVTSTDRSAPPIFVGDGGEPILNGEVTTGRISGSVEAPHAEWAPDGRSIVYRKKSDDNIQLWQAWADGSGEQQLTTNQADVLDFQWSEDGTRIYFNVTATTRADYADALRREGEGGYLYDERFIAAASRKPVFKNVGANEGRGGEVAPAPYVYDVEKMTEQLAPEPVQDDEEKWKEALENLNDGMADRDFHSVVKHGERFAWLENTQPQLYQGFSPPLTLGRRANREEPYGELCEAPECTGKITNIWLGRSDDTVYFRRREGANFTRVSLYAWTPSGEIKNLVTSDEWFEGCEMGVGALYCFAENWTGPRRIVSIDLSNGEMVTLVDPNPEFRNIQFTDVETLTWSGDDGAEAVGHLVYPADYVPGQQYPLVVVQYRSRGFLRGGIGDEYPIHVLAANGFAVLSFDRPDPWEIAATEGDYWARERANWNWDEDDLWERSSALSAIEYMIDELSSRGMIDPKRVGITGLSDGAETVWYAMMYSDYFAAAAASSGGWSPSIYYLIPGQMRRDFHQFAAGLSAPGYDNDERWRKISPEFHASTINTPILIQAPDSELLESAPPHEALKDAGKPVEMYVFPNEYHVKFEPKHRAAVYERNVDWMNFWLRDVEDPKPEKAAQYERWRRLREQRDAAIEKALQ